MPETARRGASTSWARGGGLALCAVLTASRAPRLLFEPRLFAEEASVYLAQAFGQNGLRSLLLVPVAEGPAGYLHLVANLTATLAAKLLPLELAPAFFTLVALAVQLLPCALVLWGRSRFWTTPARRVACALLLVLAPAVRPPVWLSVLQAQVFLGLAAFLVLGEDLHGAGRRRLWAYRLVLAVGGLTGPYTGLLAVPFAFRAWREKDGEPRREALVQAGIVTAGLLVQAAVYVATVALHGLAPDRLAPPWPRLAGAVLLEHLVQPVLGTPVVDGLRAVLPRAALRGLGPAVLLGLLFLALGLRALVLRRRGRPGPGGEPWAGLFVLSFAVLSAATSILAYGLPRERYAVLPGMVVVLGLLAASWRAPGFWTRRLAASLVILAFGNGIATFWRDAPNDRHGLPVGFFGRAAAGRPDWQEEVAAWRRDPRHRLRVWPYTAREAWTASLARCEDFAELRASFARVADFHLVATGRPVERWVELAPLPADFRVVVRGSSDRPAAEVVLEAVLEDGDGAALASRRLTGFGAGPFTADFVSDQLPTPPGRDLGAAEVGASPLGSPRFAAVAPLFGLLPRRLGSWRRLVVPAVFAVLLTFGIVSTLWTPT